MAGPGRTGVFFRTALLDPTLVPPVFSPVGLGVIQEPVRAAITSRVLRVWGWMDCVRRRLRSPMPRIRRRPSAAARDPCELEGHCRSCGRRLSRATAQRAGARIQRVRAGRAARTQPHRVLVQVPDAFDTSKRCVVVPASSGSRGIYGAIAVAGAWGLPQGCAVVYTDKGAGTDFFDLDSGTGVAVDGTVAARSSSRWSLLRRSPYPECAASRSSTRTRRQSRGGLGPSCNAGRAIRPAVAQSLFPPAAPFTLDNTHVIAVGISNGGGAVLRAGEMDGDNGFDAVVAVEPNVTAPGARPLFDIASEAALLQPCAALAGGWLQLLPEAMWKTAAEKRCATLATAGMIEGQTRPLNRPPRSPRVLKQSGWTDDGLRIAGLSTGFDLWRAIATYAQAYARHGVTHRSAVMASRCSTIRTGAREQ